MLETPNDPLASDESLLREGITSLLRGDDPAARSALGEALTARLEREIAPSDESLPAWLARDLAVAWLRLGRWADTVGGPGEVLTSFDAWGLADTEWPRTDPTRHRRVFEAVIARLGIAAADVATILAKHHAVEARLLRRRRLIDALRGGLSTENGRLTREAVTALLDLFLPGIPDADGVHAAVTRTSVVLLAPTAAGPRLARWFPAQRSGYDARDGDPERVARLAHSAGFEVDEVRALLGDCVRVTLDDDLDAALLRETFGRLGAGDLVPAVRWRDARRGRFVPLTLCGVLDRAPDAPRLLDALHVDRDGAAHADARAMGELLDRWARARAEGEVPCILAELAAESVARHASLFRARRDREGAAGADVFARTLRLLTPLRDDLRPMLEDLLAPRALDRLAAEAAWALPLRDPARLPGGLGVGATLALRDGLAPLIDGAARVSRAWTSLDDVAGDADGHSALGALWRLLVRVQCRIDALTDARLGRAPSHGNAGRDLALMLFLLARQAERGRAVGDMDDFLARYAARVLDLVASVERAHGFSEDRRGAVAEGR
jgi:hypothetical protein